MERRTFLRTAGLGLVGGLAGCTEDGSSTADNSPEGSDEAPGNTPSVTDTDTGDDPTATESDASGGEETVTESDDSTAEKTKADTTGASYKIRIQYSGAWAGNIATAGSSRSIQGEGSETIDVEGDASILSANAQKDDANSEELVIQILKGGEVVKESATTAEYGLAQVSLAGGGDSTPAGDGSNFAMVVRYDGQWQGSITAGGSSRSVQGDGNETIDIEGSPNIISVNAQKKDDSTDKLTVQITKDGEVVKETSTSAEYGVAQVTYTNY